MKGEGKRCLWRLEKDRKQVYLWSLGSRDGRGQNVDSCRMRATTCWPSYPRNAIRADPGHREPRRLGNGKRGEGVKNITGLWVN